MNDRGIVVSLTEDEGGQDDVDDVELQAEQAHRPEDPDPAHRERQESGDTHRQAQGQAQEEKDDDAAQEADPVEILRQHPRQRAGHVVHREAEGAVGQGRTQGRLGRLQVIRLQIIDHLHLFLPRKEHRRSQRPGNRSEIVHILHRPAFVQHLEERLEGMGRETGLQTGVDDAVRQVGTGLQEGVPTGQALRLLLLRWQERAQAGEAGC